MTKFEKAITIMEELKCENEWNIKALENVTQYVDAEDLNNNEGLKRLAKAIIYHLAKEDQDEVMEELNSELSTKLRRVV